MSSITFRGLQKVQNSTQNTFLDVHLDFANPVQRDIQADAEQKAVINSLVNLFNTVPGQNLLNPTYGLNLAKYLFFPATGTTANLIGQEIVNNLTFFEPRAQVQNVNVTVQSDLNQMLVTLSILIPALNATLVVNGSLTPAGFTLLN